MRALAVLAAWGVWCGAAAAQTDPAALDKLLYDALKEMHNRAADLYNGGDPNGCYRMFQGGLLMARPLLAHRPDVQQLIDQGMQNADRQASIPQRARVLHETIEAVRGKIKPTTAAKPPAQPVVPPAPPLGPSRTPAESGPGLTPPPAATDTLWKRLGGEEKVTQVVDDFLTMILDDPKVNLSRNGKYKLDKDAVEVLKLKMVGYISSLSQGPVAPSGKSMAEVHRGMTIQGAEFDAFTASLRIALEKRGVAAKDVTELMDKITATRKDIVSPGGDGR